MSQRAAYLRDQADKLQWHADQIADAEIKERLRKLAREYIERAAMIESEEPSHDLIRSRRRNRYLSSVSLPTWCIYSAQLILLRERTHG
jgi:hypothetical protein